MAMQNQSRVRLEDIAQVAGLTKMTVSLALRDEPRIPEATRQRIKQIAKRLGYRPDPALNALNAYRRQHAKRHFTGSIGFINAFPEPLGRTPLRYYAQYFAGAKRRGAELGFVVEEFWLRDEGMNENSLHRILRSRGINTVILGPFPATHANFTLPWEEYSAVALGFSLKTPRLHTVANNQFQSMALCVTELVKLGYRRIALCLQRQQDERVQRRWSGAYFATCHGEGCPTLRPYIFDQFEGQTFVRWCTREKPEVIVTGLPDLVDMVQELGLRVPQDIGIAMPYESAYDEPRHLAHIDERHHLNGAAAVDLVAGMYYRNERGVPAQPLHVLIQGEWRPGTTIASVGNVRPAVLKLKTRKGV